MWANYHMTFQQLNFLPQDWGNFTEEKCLHFPVSQKLHLTAPLEHICPIAFIIEMILMLFLDTVMEECSLG